MQLLHSHVHYHEVTVPSYPLFHYQPYELALSSKLVDMVKLHGIELLHVHYAIPHAASAFYAKQLVAYRDLKVITTLHGTDITVVGKDPSFWKMTKFSIEKSDGVTAVSHYLAQRTAEEFKTTYPIKVIPNFIEPIFNHFYYLYSII